MEWLWLLTSVGLARASWPDVPTDFVQLLQTKVIVKTSKRGLPVQTLAEKLQPTAETFFWPCFVDPIPSEHAALFGMAIGMAIVAMLLCTLIWVGSGTAKSSSVADSREVPVMIVLDVIKAYVIFDIIEMHMTSNLWTGLLSYHELVIMSGFLAFSMECPRRELFDWAGSASYIARRLARLIPGYYALLIYTVVTKGPAKPYVAWPLSSLLLQSFFTGRMCSDEVWLPFTPHGAGHGWFVSMIVWQAVSIPMLFNCIQKWCKNVSTLACVYITTLAIVHLAQPLKSLQLGTFKPVNDNSPIYQLLNTITGCCAAQACNFLSTSARKRLVWLFVLPASLALVAAIRRKPNVIHLAGIPETMTFEVFLFSVSLVSSRCVAEIDMPRVQQTSLFSGLKWLISCLGYYSYGAYLYQWIAASVTEENVPHRVTHWSWLLAWMMAIPSDYLLETPFCQFVNRKLMQKQ